MANYQQGDIVWADYPFSDQPEKSKLRPVLIVSNETSNRLDSDFLITPVTSKLRGESFEVLLSDDLMTVPLPFVSVVRCNKLYTIRESRIISKLSELKADALPVVIERITAAFSN